METRQTLMRSDEVRVRWAGTGDEPALRRLAALDSRRAVDGPTLVASRGDELVAAMPLERGEAIADPFQPTADLLALLELRVRQLR